MSDDPTAFDWTRYAMSPTFIFDKSTPVLLRSVESKPLTAPTASSTAFLLSAFLRASCAEEMVAAESLTIDDLSSLDCVIPSGGGDLFKMKT